MPQSLVLVAVSAALFHHANAQLGALPSGIGGVGDEVAAFTDTGADAIPAPTAADAGLAAAGAPVQAVAFAVDTVVEPQVEGIDRLEQPFVGLLPRLCNCTTPVLNPTTSQIEVGDIRGLSNEFCDGGDSPTNSFGLSNMVWAWGQFIDHDVVGSEEESGRENEVPDIHLDAPNRIMPLTRLGPKIGDGDDGECEGQRNSHTGLIDGHPIYSASAEGEESLRDPESCRLISQAGGENGDFLPLSNPEDLTNGDQGIFIVAGDKRVNEHSVLTSMHTIWLREHNRLCGVMETNPRTSGMSKDQQFETVKATVIAKMQWITVQEFLPALGITSGELRRAALDGFDIPNSLATVEFSIAWRLGHTLIPDQIGMFAVQDLFRGERNFLVEEMKDVFSYSPTADALITDLMDTLAATSASEIDGKMSNALRNVLFGAPIVGLDEDHIELDLCSFNLFRGRDLHVPTYAGLAECVGVEPDADTEATTPDAWLGLLREPKGANDVLGPTLKAIVVEHFARVLFGPDGNYFLERSPLGTALRNKLGIFRVEVLQETSMATIISANSGATITGNAFMT